ncbi:MAG: 50S ribosomal protein L3 [Chloroflexi bacterium]|nr:50S ribosomal protein L3 [Chloroflexota bacterium]MCI0580498.1 50S ribosomal protein L3 [Chloroflexota bacterium]MCI0649242.1 50S ribosomal protein L3 [Chloroflexota bacterium]MCI0727946.1 50S ribosomal protein L3 [Chloroflexota bacterium]
MKGLLGFKLGMTQIIDDNGVVMPVTVVQAGPCYVTQVKTSESDGYEAVQVGFGEAKEKRLTKGQRGHLALLKTDQEHPKRKKSAGIPAVRYLREFRTGSAGDYKVGQILTVEQFQVGDRVDIIGKTKGRGFAGVVKRHGFRGGPKTHGQSDRWRAPGSIGSTSGMGRVIKGLRMAGRMGNERATSQNLEVVRIDPERNLIALKGSVPGTKGGLVVIRDAAKG